jgi:hypothetical protein
MNRIDKIKSKNPVNLVNPVGKLPGLSRYSSEGMPHFRA